MSPTYPSLEQQLAQLLILGFRGSLPKETDPLLNHIGNDGLGGVILFDRHLATGSETNNIGRPDQLRQLTATLQNACPDNKLFIAIDQEGGMVSRLKKERGYQETPAARLLGEEGMAATEKSSRVTASLLASLGINVNLAPVADLNQNPDNPIIAGYHRAFSADPKTVADHCRIWIKEHHNVGILSCLKHFPGHGSSFNDSHLGFVDISDSWQESELLPYKELVSDTRGLAIMTGHLFNRNLDPDNPATLSRQVIDILLRKELGYKGPVLSDDMQMKAITDRYGLEDACCRAIAAGIDLLVVGNNLEYEEDIFTRLINGLLRGLERGILTEERVAEAYNRVMQIKKGESK